MAMWLMFMKMLLISNVVDVNDVHHVHDVVKAVNIHDNVVDVHDVVHVNVNAVAYC
jgi:hypothetical protein